MHAVHIFHSIAWDYPQFTPCYTYSASAPKPLQEVEVVVIDVVVVVIPVLPAIVTVASFPKPIKVQDLHPDCATWALHPCTL